MRLPSRVPRVAGNPAVRSLVTTQRRCIAERGIKALNRKIDELLVADDDEFDGTDAIKLIEKLMKIASELPNVVKVVGDLEERVKQEQTAETKLRGVSKGLLKTNGKV